MRNLKRALSLALASVMLLGMMVVGSSAASYPDVDDNDNVEAIEVLNAVKVMIGDHGSFNPDKAVNRHEMAVIMAKLVLGNEAADNYVGSHPFTDVYPWADKYVAACYENGLVSGTSATTYGGNQPLTAVQAAAMMLRALGYKDLSKGATDWRAPVTAMANQIRLFSGVASNPKEQLTRNQVAQLALNTLKSPVVDLKDGTFDISSGDGQVVISGGQREYIVRSSNESYARAINRTERAGTSASSVQGYTVELGEHLYNGKLYLNDSDYDDFGRPARKWEYDGVAVGTYAKTELLRAEYTEKVTGKMLYDLLGSSTVKDFEINVTIDGNTNNDPKNFGRADMTRTNTDAVGATGNGVLTQVYVDGINKKVDIAVINTYLAVADGDYSASRDEVTLKVYNLEKSGNLYNKDYKKVSDGNNSWKDAETPLKVAGDDFAITGVKKDDLFLVTVAAGDIMTMVAPEVLSEQTITSHKVDKYVVAGKQYDYATTAQYDTEVMESFGSADMKEVTYDIMLDKYGYLIGVEQNEKVDEYVFLTGIDDAYSYLSKKNVPVNIIHMDGTMETVTMNTSDSTKFTFTTAADASQVNTWCTYSVDNNGIYTLKVVSGTTNDGTTKYKVAQAAQDAAGADIKINSKNISLNGTAPFNRVHGNDSTVYINAEMDNVVVASGTYRRIVSDVDSVTTGVTNVDMTVSDIGSGGPPKTVTGTDSNPYTVAANEVYTLYKDNGTIIAVVTLEAVDNATTKHYAYINSSNIDHRDYDASAKEYSWYRQAIVDGEFVMLKEVDDDTSSDYLNTTVMERGKWYEIKYNADGEVRGIDEITYAAGETDDNTYNASDVPTGTNYNVGIHFMRNANYVANALDKTFILNADFTTEQPELKWVGGTLYTGNDSTKGVYVAPTAKVVVFTKNYDKHEEFSGADMEKALSALIDKKAFNGYVNAVIGSNGVATVVILDEKNMNEADKFSVTFTNLDKVTAPAGNITNIAEGGSATFNVTPKSGYTLNSVVADGVTLTPVSGVYTINNITANVNVVINVTKDANTYAGEVEFDTTTANAVTAEWIGEAKPTNSELASLLIDELVSQGYDKSTASITALSDSDISITIKRTINGVAGPQETYKINPSTGLTQVVEATTQAELEAALAGAATKIKLTANATLAASTAKDIEVASGATLTISHASTAIAVTGNITGEGNVTVSGAAAVTGGAKIAVSGKVTLARNIDALSAVKGNVDVTENVTVTGALTMQSGKTLTITDAKALTVSGAATIPGSVTATGTATGGTLNLNGTDSVGSIDNKVNLVNTAGTLAINGTVAPKALTQTAGKITVAAGGSLTLPAATLSNDGVEVSGTLTLGGAVTTGNAATAIDVKATGILNLNGKTLTGVSGAKIAVASGAQIKGVSGANIYANDKSAIATDITADGSVATYDWTTQTGTMTGDGWVANA